MTSPLRIIFPALCLASAACTLKVGDLGEVTEDSDAGPGETTDSTGGPGGDPSGATDEDPTTTSPATGLTGETDTGTGTDTDEPAPEVAGVDVLFVIDNSGSMAPIQSRLADAIGMFVDPLSEAGLDLRIAVTTTDAGNPRCPAAVSKPENGAFQLSSCRPRVAEGEFTFNTIDFSDACLDVCQHDEIAISPTTTDADPNAAPRPWVEWGAGGDNIDVPLAEALACVLPQGVAGCGFESPLESMFLALSRVADPADPAHGFIRADAHLFIILITDEMDCSASPEASEIFIDNTVFWHDANDPAPTSTVCWKAGTECEGGPGTYDSCDAVDRGLDGAITANPADAALRPLSRYATILSTLQADKVTAGSQGKVQVAAITGVPVGYPQNPLVFADAADPDYQANFGVGPGCVSELDPNVTAVPPVRVRELVEQTSPLGPGLFSICQSSYGGSLGELAAGIVGE